VRLTARTLPFVLGLLVACKTPPPATPPPAIAIHVEPACDLAPAAGAQWVVEAKPRQIAEIPDLIPAIATVLPEERLQLFTASHGGVDLRQTKDLCVVQYKDSQLAVLDVPLDPERIAKAFDQRTIEPATRTILATNPRVLRLVGKVGEEDQRVMTFGLEAVALERGSSGPLRAAEAFAFMKLKKAQPVLKGAALKRAAEALGDAPFRVFAAGPFEEETAKGLGGILRATTAAGGSVAWSGRGADLLVRVVLIGAWAEDGPAAAQRLAAGANVLSGSAVGRLFGLDNPVRSPTAHVENDALVLEATIDGNALAKGLHDALDANVAEIMRK
jgi:hypothetical protein